MEIYIVNVVVKANTKNIHLENFKMAFERMRKHGLKTNPPKCAFGVVAGNFLGFFYPKEGDFNRSK